MSVVIKFFNTDDSVTLEAGVRWEANDNALDVFDSDGTKIATYRDWASINKKPKSSVQARLEEAVELVSLVDNGKFINQDDDWRERATELLSE